MPSRKSIAASAQLQAEFLASLAPESHFGTLFDDLPGVSFFAKNRRLQLVAANRAFWRRLGLAGEAELIGRDDFELFPRQLAENFRRDDREVLRTGRPKTGILELFFNAQGLPDWFVTSKRPLLDRSGRVAGLMGVSQSYAGRHQALSPYLQLNRAVEHLRAHFREPVAMTELARLAGLSVRQFNRRFREAFGVSPQAFLIRTRIGAACESLRGSDKPISDIAAELGFYDQSSFTVHFGRNVGMTPLKYRRESSR